jgi:hypothetical protein
MVVFSFFKEFTMIVACYGGGTDSSAALIECVNRKIPVDIIVFADTGGEKTHTYQYIEYFSEWLVSQGYPSIDIVRAKITLEEDCLKRNALPSIAYGFKTCSQRFKTEPQDKFFNNHPLTKAEWQTGRKVTKIIGFDADESHRIKHFESKKFENWYPLVDWDMGRDDCINTIKNAGLVLPGKSACFFCPSSKKSEVSALAKNYPELLDRAIQMEKNADLTKIKGLGRSYAWGDLVKQIDMLDESFDRPPEIVCGCFDG